MEYFYSLLYFALSGVVIIGVFALPFLYDDPNGRFIHRLPYFALIVVSILGMWKLNSKINTVCDSQIEQSLVCRLLVMKSTETDG